MKTEGNHIIADDGMTLRRKADGLVFGKDLFLGYSYYLNGIPVEPFLEKPEDYEEIEDESELTDEDALNIILNGNETN